MVMNQVLHYIEEHLKEPLDSKQLASVAGYSQYHFSRLFKSHTNETVMEYVCRRRLIRAAEDIAAGMRIIDVAFQYGWQSHSAFSKSFNRKFGFSPSLLRTMKLELDSIRGGGSMRDIFLTSTEIGASKEELLQQLRLSIKENAIAISGEQLNHHYRTACEAYEGKKRYSGEEYVTHPINVAILLTELGADADTILAGMFCDVAAKGDVSKVKNKLPESVWRIVERLDEKELNLNDMPNESTLIKLAERLHNMRTIEFIDDSKKAERVKETIELYMPLARRVNNRKLIDELNDLAMKYKV